MTLYRATKDGRVKLSKKEENEVLAERAKAEEIQVPQSVTMTQARLALLDAGLLDSVMLLIKTQTPEVKIFWDTSATLNRSHPIIATMTKAMKLTEKEMDNLFIAAGDFTN